MKHQKIRIKETDELTPIDSYRLVRCSGGVFVNGESGVLESRDSGEFEGKGFYLGSGFDWIMGTDSEGLLVLVPLKKE